MDREIIKNLIERRPFKAFEIGVSAGENFAVKHPELVVLGKNVFAVMTRSGEPQVIKPEMIWVDYGQINFCRPMRTPEVSN